MSRSYLRGNIIYIHNHKNGYRWIGVVTRTPEPGDAYVTARFAHPSTGKMQNGTQNVRSDVVTYVGDIPVEAVWDIND